MDLEELTGNEKITFMPEQTTFFNLHCSFEIFSCHITTVPVGWQFSKQTHRQFELNYIRRGLMEVELGDRVLRLNQGDVFLINPGEDHTSRNAGDDKLSFLCFHFDLDYPLFKERLSLHNSGFHPADTELAKHLHPKLEQTVSVISDHDGNSYVNIRILALLFDIVTTIGEELSGQENDPGTSKPAALKLAQRLAEELWRASHTPPGGDPARNCVETAARNACISPSYCTKVFRQVFGVSPRSYVTTLRLRQAKKLLLDADTHIDEVSRQLGYMSVSDFSRQFKRWTGESPSAFRLNARRVYEKAANPS